MAGLQRFARTRTAGHEEPLVAAEVSTIVWLLRNDKWSFRVFMKSMGRNVLSFDSAEAFLIQARRIERNARSRNSRQGRDAG
jgi:hypothetical protein